MNFSSEDIGDRGADFVWRHFIGGRWCAAGDSEANLNPSDPTDVVGRYPQATRVETDDAIAAARAALPGWSGSSIQLRSDILRQAGDLLIAHSAGLAQLLAREEGKRLVEARAEIVRSGQIFHFFSGEALRHQGSFGPGLRAGFNVTVGYEPVGVVALITPWNFPMAVPAWKLAAALAYGNTAVLKPSEHTPGCAVALTEILTAAGLPAGVLNLLLGRGSELGEGLVRDVDALSFTGSTPVGRALLARAAPSMIKVQMELGGKNPLLVADDADIELAVNVAVEGSFGQTGQRCTASSRIIVMRTVHDRFVDALVARARQLRVGAALNPEVDLGPVANAPQLARNLAFVQEAEREGAQRLCGGEVLDRPGAGHFFQPAVFVDTHAGMRLNREEIFGPIVGVIRVEDLDEGIAVANDSAYALSAGICTRSISTAEQFRRRIRAGMVMINAPTAGVDYHVPFGGRAPSACGPREQGPTAAEFFTEIKTTYVNHGVV
jgi:aldehyde dehydrogenase (NAD+)